LFQIYCLLDYALQINRSASADVIILFYIFFNLQIPTPHFAIPQFTIYYKSIFNPQYLIPHSTFRIPHSPFHILHSTFRIPHSTFRNSSIYYLLFTINQSSIHNFSLPIPHSPIPQFTIYYKSIFNPQFLIPHSPFPISHSSIHNSHISTSSM